MTGGLGSRMSSWVQSNTGAQNSKNADPLMPTGKANRRKISITEQYGALPSLQRPKFDPSGFCDYTNLEVGIPI